jgi:ParB-like chromosome segregation protein Spo0J
MKKYENHPIAELFPMLSTPEIIELSHDIEENGLMNPIVLYEGKILDGRNRYEACKMIEVEPSTVEYGGDTPLKYVVSLNLHRRHLKESQRAAIAAKIADMEQGDNSPEIGAKGAESDEFLKSVNLRPSKTSIDEAAKMMNVSPSLVDKAKRVMREAPEMVADIEAGNKTINKAMKVIKERQEAKQGGRKYVKKGPPSDAMGFVENAILSLEQIKPNDVQHKEAWAHIRRWLNEHE